ncbi:MAG: hypothetical protein IT256_02995 [Chitinophagaceae bacterium]|nr:hypothetical protein [Chitinophagaceae bacterium]
MSTHKDFLAPRLTGKRFEDHSIPLELLEDFAAFEQLLIEMAKVIYLEKNDNRQRVPRGFEESVSLKLYAIGEGSAIPKIALIYALATAKLATPTLELFPDANYACFEEARDRIYNGIDAANTGANITEFIPENLLGFFNKIGKRLKDDEAIDFDSSSDKTLKLDRATRKKLVLASSKIKQVTEETNIIASIPEADKSKHTFTILVNGLQRINAEIPEAHYETILKAFNDYEKNCKVSVKGIGRFNQFDKLESFESIEQISIIDPLDVIYRLDEISLLEDGWLNGEGVAPTKDGLDWFANMFEGNFDKNLPLPFIFPTPEGGIQAEWSLDGYDISLNINLESKDSNYHELNFLNDADIELKFALGNPEDWRKLNLTLNKLVNL